jgi:hypothetical protein
MMRSVDLLSSTSSIRNCRDVEDDEDDDDAEEDGNDDNDEADLDAIEGCEVDLDGRSMNGGLRCCRGSAGTTTADWLLLLRLLPMLFSSAAAPRP